MALPSGEKATGPDPADMPLERARPRALPSSVQQFRTVLVAATGDDLDLLAEEYSFSA